MAGHGPDCRGSRRNLELNHTRESKQGFPDWNRYAIPPSAITAVKTVGAEMCLKFSI